MNTNKVAVHESKNSDRVIMFVDLDINELTKVCSINYAKKIIKAHDNNLLFGLWCNSNGKLRAKFI